MTDITDVNRDTLPSNVQLLKATGVALVAAAAILVTIVLPAEYGIDPTGIGQRLGLDAFNAESTEAMPETPVAPVNALSPADALWEASTPYRNDELSLILRPDEGAEIKARMKAGERFVFSWAADGGEVSFDMHGERSNAASDEFTSFLTASNTADGHGTFQAPFEGTHGWYWHNSSDRAVTITLKTSGFYETLYRP